MGEEGMDELKENFESEGGEKTRRGAHGGEMTELCDSGRGKSHRRRRMWCMSRWNLCVSLLLSTADGEENAANGTRWVCRARHAAKHGRKCKIMGDFG